MISEWNEPGPTSAIEHEANPGLISHFMKHWLLEIAQRAMVEGRTREAQDGSSRLGTKINQLACQLGVEVIYCRARDTWVTD
jgi:homospermidine synthase